MLCWGKSIIFTFIMCYILVVVIISRTQKKHNKMFLWSVLSTISCGWYFIDMTTTANFYIYVSLFLNNHDIYLTKAIIISVFPMYIYVKKWLNLNLLLRHGHVPTLLTDNIDPHQSYTQVDFVRTSICHRHCPHHRQTNQVLGLLGICWQTDWRRQLFRCWGLRNFRRHRGHMLVRWRPSVPLIP